MKDPRQMNEEELHAARRSLERQCVGLDLKLSTRRAELRHVKHEIDRRGANVVRFPVKRHPAVREMTTERGPEGAA